MTIDVNCPATPDIKVRNIVGVVLDSLRTRCNQPVIEYSYAYNTDTWAVVVSKTASGPTQTVFTHTGAIYNNILVNPPSPGPWFWCLCVQNPPRRLPHDCTCSSTQIAATILILPRSYSKLTESSRRDDLNRLPVILNFLPRCLLYLVWRARPAAPSGSAGRRFLQQVGIRP